MAKMLGCSTTHLETLFSHVDSTQQYVLSVASVIYSKPDGRLLV